MKYKVLIVLTLLLVLNSAIFAQANKAPVVTVPGNQTVLPGQLLSFTVSASDENAGQTLQFRSTGVPPGATFVKTSPTQAQFTWTPSGTQTGSYTVGVKVVDNGSPELSSSTRNINITVTNRTPQLTVPGRQSVAVGQPLTFAVTASDADTGQTLKFSAVGLPSLATFKKVSPTQAEFDWNPNEDHRGPYTVTFKVEDNGFPVRTETRTVVVAIKSNSAPVLTVPGTQTVAPGQPLSFLVNAVDPDQGQRLRLTATELPEGSTFSQQGASRAEFKWTPNGNQTGTYTIRTKVVDAGAPSLSDTGLVRIVVQNRAPEILVPASQTVMAGSLLKFVVIARDADQRQDLEITTQGLPRGATLREISPTRIEFNWTPASAQTGSYQVSFKVTDDGSPRLSQTRSLQIKVMRLDGWTKVNGANNVIKQFTGLKFMGSNLFASSLSGVFVSTNNGDSWAQVNNGLTDINVSRLAVSGSRLFALTGSGLFMSANSGQNWTKVTNGLPDSSIQHLVANGNLLLASTVDKVFLSTDSGESWRPAYSGGTATFLAIDGTTLYVADQPYVCRSVDNGQTWRCNTLGPLYPPAVSQLAVSGNKLIAAVCGGFSSPVISTDGGENWSGSIPLGQCISTFAAVGSDLLFTAVDDRVYLSTNFGQSWAKDYKEVKLAGQFALRDNVLFAATSSGELFKATIIGSY